MTNTKITRTVNIAVVSFVLANTAKMEMSNQVAHIPTTQKLSDNAIKHYIENSLTVNETLLKVNDVHYESALYEMDLETFIANAKVIGNGRITL